MDPAYQKQNSKERSQCRCPKQAEQTDPSPLKKAFHHKNSKIHPCIHKKKHIQINLHFVSLLFMNPLYKGSGAVFVKDTAQTGNSYLRFSTAAILFLHNI